MKSLVFKSYLILLNALGLVAANNYRGYPPQSGSSRTQSYPRDYVRKPYIIHSHTYGPNLAMSASETPEQRVLAPQAPPLLPLKSYETNVYQHSTAYKPSPIHTVYGSGAGQTRVEKTFDIGGQRPLSYETSQHGVSSATTPFPTAAVGYDWTGRRSSKDSLSEQEPLPPKRTTIYRRLNVTTSTIPKNVTFSSSVFPSITSSDRTSIPFQSPLYTSFPSPLSEQYQPFFGSSSGYNYKINKTVSQGVSSGLPKSPIIWRNRTWSWSSQSSSTSTAAPSTDVETDQIPIKTITLPIPRPTSEKVEEFSHKITDQVYQEWEPNPLYPLSGRTCSGTSCNPATGNLLVGRENQLSATSTCGTKMPEEYCVVLQLSRKERCNYTCDATNPYFAHPISNIVSRSGQHRMENFWKSENGREEVSIQLDLEAEFHFTHMIMTFKTFRPAAMLIERSHDFGRTWSVYQYYAADCNSAFPNIPFGPRTRISDVVCESKYSDVEPSDRGEVVYRVVPPNLIRTLQDPYHPEVQSLLKITNLRVNFTRLHTLGDDKLDMDNRDILKKYYYAVYDMVVRGSCFCYGHAARCIAPEGTQQVRMDTVYGRCECFHHTTGPNCNRCEDFYLDQPWKPGLLTDSNECKRCNCNNHSNRCEFNETLWELSDRKSGGQCLNCLHTTEGPHCERCSDYFYHDPRRSIQDPLTCLPCRCSKRGSEEDGRCEQATDPEQGTVAGRCHCKDNVGGELCDRCLPGYWELPENAPQSLVEYYGAASFYETNSPCRPCPCPGIPGSGLSHASTCELNQTSARVICHCKEGYTGERCERCADNYYGEPGMLGGDCRKCECNGNTNEDIAGSCDTRTGECLKCLYNSAGAHCERCRDGFFGNALEQRCTPCVCNALGTNMTLGSCDHLTGKCPCFPNVEGQECDHCAANHWKLASGEGCAYCGCDSQGSFSLRCHEFTGMCHCRPGYGGLQCNECEADHYGNPKVACFPCDCDMSGSKSSQCDRESGRCECIPGIGGDKCNECARGYIGRAPHCRPCGECFDDWDLKISELKNQTSHLIEKAKKIKQTGTTGAYTRDFTEIETNLNEIANIVAGQNLTATDLERLDGMLSDVRQNLTLTENELTSFEKDLEDTRSRIITQVVQMNTIRSEAAALERNANDLRANATNIKEANVEGAYNSTLEAQKKSRAAEERVRNAAPVLFEAQKKRQLTETFLENAQIHYNNTFKTHDADIANLLNKISSLENQIPELNFMVCSANTSASWTCEHQCGGAGCGKCGGIGCPEAAVSKAEAALEMANKAEAVRKAKHEKAQGQLEAINEARMRADQALKEARDAFERAQRANNVTSDSTKELQELLNGIDAFLSTQAAKPSEIRTLAEECLNQRVSLNPEEITDLARQINQTIDSLTDIGAILAQTSKNLTTTEVLKRRADKAKAETDDILDISRRVIKALEEAQESQEKAVTAINGANRNIDQARQEMEEIGEETETASRVAEKANQEIGSLSSRVDELKKKSLDNQFNMQKANKVGADAERASNLAKAAADDLESLYTEASAALARKTQTSGDNKARVDALKEQARALAENATRTLRDFQQINEQLMDNESKLKDYQSIVNQLTNQAAEHLGVIDERQKFYTRCQS